MWVFSPLFLQLFSLSQLWSWYTVYIVHWFMYLFYHWLLFRVLLIISVRNDVFRVIVLGTSKTTWRAVSLGHAPIGGISCFALLNTPKCSQKCLQFIHITEHASASGHLNKPAIVGLSDFIYLSMFSRIYNFLFCCCCCCFSLFSDSAELEELFKSRILFCLWEVFFCFTSIFLFSC